MIQLRVDCFQLLLACICLQFLSICNSLQFNYKDFVHIPNITLLGSSQQSGSRVILLPEADPKDISSSSEYKFGWMVFKEPIPLIISTSSSSMQKSAQSFNTSFNFQIVTPGSNVINDFPSGMTFFFSTNNTWSSIIPSSDMKYLGLANNGTVDPAADPFFAVEFDSRKSNGTNDPSASHIGIDINSIDSAKTLDTTKGDISPILNLHQNYTFRAWIGYDSSLQLTKIWMVNIDPPADYNKFLDPPAADVLKPILEYQYDLAYVFVNQDNLYVGFSAATTEANSTMLGSVRINSWYFSISESSVAARSNLRNRYIEIIIISLALIACFSVASALAMAFYCKRIQKKLVISASKGLHSDESGTDLLVYSAAVSLPRYSYQELESSTNGFNTETLIGEGGFSRVYKGKLADGSMVAIKRLKDGIRKEAEFSAELRMINSIRHKNLLQLQGWSYGNGEALLVYKFMSNGSLNQYIYGEREEKQLDSATRLRILSGVAAALEYLHIGLGDCVLHRDVKAANVLLTDEFEPVLGDFGLARLIKHNQIVTATMVGTVGYVAPEVVITGTVTDKADVYSFGVLLLEVSCGCRAINRGPLESYRQPYLVKHVSELQQNGRIREAVDASILQLDLVKSKSNENDTTITNVQEQWERILHLGLLCCHQSPMCRPDMRYVNQEIYNIMRGNPLSLPSPRVNEYPQSSHIEAPILYEYLASIGSSSTSITEDHKSLH